MEYTIIGGGIAAYAALKAIRDLDRDNRVTVVSEEEHCFYYRPMTPLMLKGDRERDELLYAGELPDFHTIHDRASGLDPATRTITLAHGAPISFQRLLIATGSSPLIPKIKGLSRDNVYLLRTLGDAERLRQAAKAAKSAIIIGGGLVGIKKAVALHRSGLAVTVIEQQEEILLPRLDREGAAMVAAKLRREGITILTGEGVVEIDERGKSLTLASGGKLAADLICVAAGVRPNLEWLAGSGLAIEQALVVDKRMRTSGEGIYGAGDVVQTRDLVTGKNIVSALWTNAVAMGRTAGLNMAGGKMDYPGSLEVMNATEIEQLAMVSVGEIEPAGDGYEVAARRSGETYRKLVFRDEALVGAVFLGDIAKAGVYSALIKSGRPLGSSLREKARRGTLNYLDVCRS
jgi:NAD(P)H-nitrite reductase large subunit